MTEFDRDKFYNVSRTMAAADKLLPADEQPDRCQGLPLHEIARMICDEQRKACGDNECRCATARLAVDATVDATRTRIEALIEANQGMDPRTRVGMWEVLALLEGQEHATQVGKPMEEGSR